MQKKSSVQNEKMQLWLQSEGEKYLELLKRGQVECRDFSGETLKQLLALKENYVDDFPASVKGELMYRKLIPADFRSLELPELLKMLIQDEWYGLTSKEIGEQLQSRWREFSPDMLLRIIKHHPTIFHSWPDWEWNCTESGSTAAWGYLLERHHGFIAHCPVKVLAAFTPEERCKLALSSPGLAAHLDLDLLPSEMRDLLLRKKPELAGHFTFAPDDPPGKLIVDSYLDNCNAEESKIAGKFLAGLFPELTEEEAVKMADAGEGMLGVFTRQRGELLQKEINDFLQANKISVLALEARWNPLETPLFVPVDNLEAQILEGATWRIIQGCLDGEKLSRSDILRTGSFCHLKEELRALVLMKAILPELRLQAIGELTAEDAPGNLIEELKAACALGNGPAAYNNYEKILLDAAAEKDFKIVKALSGTVCFQFLAVDEVLKIYRDLPEKTVQKFFDLSLSPLLRGYLLAELSEGESTSEKIDVINMLLEIFRRPPNDPDEPDPYFDFNDFDDLNDLNDFE